MNNRSVFQWTKVLLDVLVIALLTIGSENVFGQTNSFSPVTSALLDNPSSNDWLHWRRTQDAWGYSPLKQINKQNVNQLQLLWSAGLSPGGYEGVPLVYAGVMYVINPPSGDLVGGVMALNAGNGDVLWDYRWKSSGKSGSNLRNLAIYEDKILFASPDAHLIALDARTGKVVWDHEVADSKLGFRYSSGPIVAKGKVIAGMAGCDHYNYQGVEYPCFISAHDPATGKELWKTSTIAKPGEPGGDTWGDLPLHFRSGGDAWIPGSFDPQMNTIYWSTSQPKPWARITRKTNGDNLYTNSVLGLDPDTGKIKWYHQFIPGETLDQDEVFESILIDQGNNRSLFKMGKLGILWEIDRKTGEHIAAHDLGYQDIVELNPRNGKVTYKAGKIPEPNIEMSHCPDVYGVRNWRAMSYSPETQAFYIPINLNCQKSMFSEITLTEGIGNVFSPAFRGQKHMGTFANPMDPEHRGGFVAIDIHDGKVLWKHMLTRGVSSSSLTTAGGLAFVGDDDRYLYAHDANSGKVLFQTRLPGVPTGSPITYGIGSKQYIAVPIAARQQVGGNAIYVFGLPN
jgi:alcohol dehydrogenase (cytochrome c)